MSRHAQGHILVLRFPSMPSPFQLHDRLAKERYEEEYLRPWAMRSRLSRGHAHPEVPMLTPT